MTILYNIDKNTIKELRELLIDMTLIVENGCLKINDEIHIDNILEIIKTSSEEFTIYYHTGNLNKLSWCFLKPSK